ncbi:hypothetical protein AUJ10_03010 [Candidatus Pacearchaeota archaeon CG1_02_31_27]|nr:MAG: hypothetical protein AUJ10_03010 [Candidatus Pacearchaeota archaeon CG1_02_31_27]PIN92056.1 MAG: metallopeptidase [Candidatus Pacearchaeota archaeon CG10_big_fil_rev_8_21_14_0_10_31_59]PIZ81082.1 MAG: metallopeptidase [Candidatus Pacearchaeota archaeon CG_4_10_14_0_2_um_filter_31_10]
MPISYQQAEDIKEKAKEIVLALQMDWINLERVGFIRSKGSATRCVIARCHTLGKIMQMAMNTEAFYVIEVISERFDRQSEDDKIKTIIHELIHIPKTFGGGFRHHDFVCENNVELMFKQYKKWKEFQSDLKKRNFF